jgi:hypothetical protein
MDDPVTDPTAATSRPSDPAGAVPRRRRATLVAIVVLAVVAGVVAWVVAGRGGSSATTAGPTSQVATPIPAVLVSASGLATLAHAVRQPIYWAGPQRGYMYELHRTSDGSVYIRYLPRGVKAGVRSAQYLTIATYPFAGAYAALKRVTDGRQMAIPRGGVVLIGSTYKKSVHLAYPNVDYQVEVYDPSPAVALDVARSGRVRPAG